jgi:hypothetical protein
LFDFIRKNICLSTRNFIVIDKYFEQIPLPSIKESDAMVLQDYDKKFTELFKNIAGNEISPLDNSQICKMIRTGKHPKIVLHSGSLFASLAENNKASIPWL